MTTAGSLILAPSTLVVAVATLLLFYVVTSILSYYRLSHIPGPTLWAWSRLPLIRTHLRGDSYDKFGELSRSYGKLVRIGPNYLLTSDPDHVRHMNAPRSSYTKSNWYLASRFTPGIDNMISDRNEQRHEVMRRKAAPAYSGKENAHLEQSVDECVLDLVNLIRKSYITVEDGHPVQMELARKAQYFTTDTISLLAFTEKFNDLRDDKDHFGYIEEVETLYPNMFCTSVIPELIEALTATGILSLFNPADNKKLAFGKVMRIAKAQVDSRLDAEGNFKGVYGDMLGSFIKHGMQKQELEQETIVQIVAGSDTTATAIRSTMLCLMKNEKAYKRLANEIDDAARAGKIPTGPDEVISDSQARQLPYLQAVIKEGLRWRPPTGGLLAKLVPKEGDTIEGYFVPGGTIVGHSQFAVHHSPDLFGPDELSFRPERWLHTSQGGDEPSWDKIKQMEKNNDLVFGHGKYQCLGKSIAFIELNKIFVELLRRFEFSLVDPENPLQTICYGIHLQRGLWVTVRSREEMAGR